MNDFSPYEKLNQANRIMSRIPSAKLMDFAQVHIAIYLTIREQPDVNETTELIRSQFKQVGIDIEDIIQKTL